MSEGSQVCPKCGEGIGTDAPQGLCPKCLLRQASFPTEAGGRLVTSAATRAVPPSREELAAAFPQLEVLELIGQGGMGFVFKARQPKLDRVVALKILAQPLAEQKMFAERFTREGRTLAKLNHPNIVTIHDFGQAGPFFYLLMEFVDGVNLRQAMRAGAVTAGQALAIVPKICEALQYAHNEGVLHRDIKPDNILLDARGRVKIADFGIAKLMAEAAAENPLTGSGASLGTPHYMAPEQIERPDAVDHRADIFSLGVVFYEMLTGELPLGRFAAPSQKGNSDPRLDDIVFQTLEKQPERRPQSAEEVRTRVEGISSTAAPAGAAAPTAVGAFRTSRCYISTPEHLQSFWGKVNIYTDAGELRLDDEQLVFTRNSQAMIIPLRSITGLTLGQYPRLTKPTGLDYICITHVENGQGTRILLTPHKNPWSPTWETNTIVHDWFSAIQQAIQAKTGRVPESNQGELQPLAGAKAAPIGGRLFKTAIVCLLPIAALFAAFYGMREISKRRNQPTELPTRVKERGSGSNSVGSLPPIAQRSRPAAPEQPEAAAEMEIVRAAVNAGEIRIELRGEPPLENRVLASVTEPTTPQSSSGLNGPGRSMGGEPISSWTVTRGGTNSDSGSAIWPIPQRFSLQRDIAPAVDRFFGGANSKTIRLTTERTALFVMTNAFGDVLSCDLQLFVDAARVIDPSAGAILLNFNARQFTNGVYADFALAYPKKVRLAATGTAGGMPVEARLTRLFGGQGGRAAFNCTWTLPAEFEPPTLQPNPAYTPRGNNQYTFNSNLHPPFAEALAALIRSSDARITHDKPLELFALTNSHDKVFRAYLELTRLRP